MGRKIIIILDPGHADDNRGGVRFNEGTNNWDYSLDLKAELEKYEDIKVYLTKKKLKERPTLKERATMFNYLKPDLFISIHSNAFNGKVSGVEAFYTRFNKNVSNKLLETLCKVNAEILNIPNRGVKDLSYGVLRYGNNAKVKTLFEMFFHDNYSDSDKFLAKRTELLKRHAEEIAKYFDKKLKKTTDVFASKLGESYKINVDVVNIRSGAGMTYKVVGKITDKGTYIITEKRNGWGKLLSGQGWIWLGL